MPPGLNLERLVHFLCQLGASWAPHGLNLAVLDTSWTPLGCVQSALAALSEPIWTPRWSSELQLVLQTAKMSSNMPFSCPSRALQTFEKYGRVIKFRGPGIFAVEVRTNCREQQRLLEHRTALSKGLPTNSRTNCILQRYCKNAELVCR